MHTLFRKVIPYEALIEAFGRHKRMARWLTLLFVFGIFYGYILPESATEQLLTQVTEKFSGASTMPAWQLFFYVFINNAIATFVTILFGVFLVFPSLALFMNGLVIGIIIKFALQTVEISALALATSLIPHGIFELPAVILAGVMGTLLGAKLYFSSRFEKGTTRKQCIKNIWQTYTRVILPFLLLAALIEATISGWLTGLLG